MKDEMWVKIKSFTPKSTQIIKTKKLLIQHCLMFHASHSLIFEKRFIGVTYCLIVLQSYLYDKGKKQIIDLDSFLLTM